MNARVEGDDAKPAEPMARYTCKDCGKPAVVDDGGVIRLCEHTGPVIAHMTAVARGAGGVR